MSALLAFIALVVAFIGGILFTRKGSAPDAQVLDLTNKIAVGQKDATDKQAIADKKVADYEAAFKKLNDSDPTKPSA